MGGTNNVCRLTYVVSVVSEFMHDRGKSHLKALECVLQYLKFTQKKKKLLLKNKISGSLTIKIYIDVNYSNSMKNKRFTFMLMYLIMWDLIVWRSKKQSIVARY